MRLSMCLAFAVALPLIMGADRPQSAAPLPGSIQLVDGYQHEARDTKDSQAGRIWKEGLEIRYDIGFWAGDHSAGIKPEDRQWSINQSVRGRRIEIVKGKSKDVTITFKRNPRDNPFDYPANFWAQPGSDENLAAMILMATSYTPVR